MAAAAGDLGAEAARRSRSAGGACEARCARARWSAVCVSGLAAHSLISLGLASSASATHDHTMSGSVGGELQGWIADGTELVAYR